MTGKQFIETRLLRGVTIREENAVAALEVMSRFAVHPKWLLYLPPTMSPTETSALPDLLEHPAEAFDYYQRQGVARVVCEEKHMGSRVVVVLGRDEAAIQRRLGLVGEDIGKCYTPAPGATSSPMGPWKRPSWPACATPWPRPASGRSSTPTGCASTPSCCRGRPRPRSW
ncbi:hypothetical protein [Hymenobacter nivis]|uniref:hypothetical protein n=1 Tax=Hymenobacter nivis TaxID=1850093 RepID=UPI0034DB2A94